MNSSKKIVIIRHFTPDSSNDLRARLKSVFSQWLRITDSMHDAKMVSKLNGHEVIGEDSGRNDKGFDIETT